MLPEVSGDLVDGNCRFDAVLGSLPAREAAAATLSVSKAGNYLNAPWVQRDLLYRSGIIVPRFKETTAPPISSLPRTWTSLARPATDQGSG